MKKIAIYYGYPSCVNRSYMDVDAQINSFQGFDIIIWGDGMQFDEHPDHNAAKKIIDKLIGCELYGYIDMQSTNLADQSYRYNNVIHGLDSTFRYFSDFGYKGVILDCIEKEYGTDKNKLIMTSLSAHEHDLHIIYNSDFFSYFTMMDTLLGCMVPKDSLLIEPFGLGHGITYALPETMPPLLSSLHEGDILILGISTYDLSIQSVDELSGLFQKYLKEAEGLGLDGWGFSDMYYSSKEPTLDNLFLKLK